MACDVCGNTGTPLVDLLPKYQTKYIKAVCPNCERIINRQHSKITELTFKIRDALVNKFIQNRKDHHDKQD